MGWWSSNQDAFKLKKGRFYSGGWLMQSKIGSCSLQSPRSRFQECHFVESYIVVKNRERDELLLAEV
jgi:hypothetical protein